MAIKFLVHGRVKDGQADAYRDLATRATASAREEPGTTEYKWLLSDDGRFMNADTYVDEDAYFAHAARVDEAAILVDYLDIVDIDGFHVFGPASDRLREALAGLNPVYYSLVETL